MRPVLLPLLAFPLLLAACAARPGTLAYERRGDEIVVAGHYFHTGAPVVLWSDPGGYDAYRVERRFAPYDESGWEASKETLDTPNRYGLRHKGDWPEPILDQVRGGAWPLDLLRHTVDQFVIHYDASGTARRCFRTLHDHRGLSVHFLLDVDGTIYQTLDLKERAWHAGPANDRSIGIEIANIGAYVAGADQAATLDKWYAADDDGRTILTIPDAFGAAGIRTPGFVGRPARDEPVRGSINGRDLVQYDLTPEQYASLDKLVTALCRIFPNLERDAPRGPDGRILTDRPLTPDELADFRGILGHHHVTNQKVDPGPAFQWDRILHPRTPRRPTIMPHR